MEGHERLSYHHALKVFGLLEHFNQLVLMLLFTGIRDDLGASLLRLVRCLTRGAAEEQGANWSR